MSELTVNIKDLTEADVKAVADLIASIHAEKSKAVKTRWRAEEGNPYWYIDTDGDIYKSTEDGGRTDTARWKCGNYYETEALAKFTKEKELVTQELEDYALAHNEGVVEWENAEQAKYAINYDYYNKMLITTILWTLRDTNQIYFTSSEISENAIKSVGEDRIKKYLFGVE